MQTTEGSGGIKGEGRLYSASTYLAFALPVDEESIFVDFECTGELHFRVILLLRPPIEDGTFEQRLRHGDLPVEFKLLRHRSITEVFYQMQMGGEKK